MDDVEPSLARGWVERWDAQQEGYLPDREDRFTVLIDAVEAGAGRPDPLVLDLGCGPGSLAVRLLRRMPEAAVVAVDADPLLLALGRAAYRDQPGLRFADHDLATPGWSRVLGLARRADAAVSTTALHWLSSPELAALYRELATVLRPGGLLLNGDHLREDEGTAPVLASLGRALTERAARRHAGGGAGEGWQDWWAAAMSDEALAVPAARRRQRGVSEDHHDAQTLRLSGHVDALHAAGFREVGTLWQRGDNRVLCAVLGG